MRITNNSIHCIKVMQNNKLELGVGACTFMDTGNNLYSDIIVFNHKDKGVIKMCGTKHRYRSIKTNKYIKMYENLLKDDEYVTLQDILENFESSYLKLGFKNGSGFIFADRINPHTLDIINNISMNEYNSLTSDCEQLKEQLSVEYDIKEQKKIKRKIKQIERTLKDYKLYTERQVLDFYKSDNPCEDEQVYRNCYIALIDGNKKCEYWTVKEYQKAQKR